MEALKAADLVLRFLPPNFSRWQREAREAGTRILSVVVAPDELARLQSPPGLKEAVLHAAERWGECARNPALERCRNRSHLETRRVQGEESNTVSPKRPAAMTVGRRPHHQFPRRGQRQRHRRAAARRYLHPALYPRDRAAGAARNPRRLHPQGRGQGRRQGLHPLARPQQAQRGRSRSLCGVASRLRHAPARASGITSSCTATSPTAWNPRRASSPAISCSRPDPTTTWAASATPRAISTRR